MSLEPVRRDPANLEKSALSAEPSPSRTELVLDVADVELATEPLPETPYKEQVDAKLKLVGDGVREPSAQQESPPRPIEACSQLHGTLVSSVKNSLVVSAFFAFTEHRPLVLSPDMLWLAIVQGFAEHVNQNAEELRHQFVAHQGRLDLRVVRNDFFKGSPENDWPGVFDELSGQIREHLGATTHDLLTPSFSTTGKAERAAAQIAMFDAFQKYFSYSFVSLCGIPQVVLEGTKEDWSDLRDRAVELGRYGPAGWARLLELALGHFVAVHEGRFHQPFWDSFYKYSQTSGKDVISWGWINVFFPYLGTGNVNPVISRLAEAWREANEFPKLSSHVWPDAMDFPLGLSRAPFSWDYRGRPYDMQWLAGFIGIKQDRETMRLRPEIGWAVRDVTQPAPSAN